MRTCAFQGNQENKSSRWIVRTQAPSPRCLCWTLWTPWACKHVSQIIKDCEPCKHLITRLVDKLEPRSPVNAYVTPGNFWTVEQKGDLPFFQTETSKLAVEISIGEAARLRLKRRKLAKFQRSILK